MQKPLKNYRSEYINKLLQLLWHQWSAVGVAGYQEYNEPWVIDPESLLIFSCSICRHDQRLFDEIVDWLIMNERFINIQRLNTVIRKEDFRGTDVLGAIASYMDQHNLTPKWHRLSMSLKETITDHPENMFYTVDGMPIPVIGEKDDTFLAYNLIRNKIDNRGLSNSFPSKLNATLLLQLRSLFGLNARCETLLYLILNEEATIKDISEQTYYAWRSIQDVLYEMGCSGQLNFPKSKKGRVYRFNGKPWLNILLNKPDTQIKWICWPPIFKIFETIYSKLDDPGLENLSAINLSAEFKILMKDQIAPKLEQANLGNYIIDFEFKDGEEYFSVFFNQIIKLINDLSGGIGGSIKQ